MNLKDKVVIVTGGNSGIGYFAIERFLKEGASVVMASRSKARAEEAIQKLNTLKLPGFLRFNPSSLPAKDNLFRSKPIGIVAQ